MMFQGPMRSHVGTNPLYSASRPSLRTVCTAATLTHDHVFTSHRAGCAHLNEAVDGAAVDPVRRLPRVFHVSLVH